MNPDFSQESGNEKKGRKIGVYITLIFHLVLIITLCLNRIYAVASGETQILIDFSKQEEIERKIEEKSRKEMMEEQAARELAELLGEDFKLKNQVASNQAHNDADSKEDIRRTNEMARELKENLRKGKDFADDLARREAEDIRREQEEANKSSVETVKSTGAEVVDWTLEGRRMVRDKVPAYKCYDLGTVQVNIEVNSSGKVTKAWINEDQYPGLDTCLAEESIKAAKQTRFSADSSKKKQIGTITYRFTAQER